MRGIMIEKSTVLQSDIEIEFAVVIPPTIVNNNGVYDSLDDD